jgi:hypothetical protein
LKSLPDLPLSITHFHCTNNKIDCISMWNTQIISRLKYYNGDYNIFDL